MKLRALSLTLVCTSLPALALLLGGCGAASVSTASVSGTAISGKVFGGQQPITGAAISLYAAGLTGAGTGATSLLNLPVSTDLNGGFLITGDYTCPTAATQVYIVASGGNPGIPGFTSNRASVLMAAIGDCGNLQPSTFLTINEATTVASAWALAQFAPAGPTSGAIFGASSSNATGLRNAFLIANNLVNLATGTAGGPALPAGATVESTKLYTLADILAVCVNSSGGGPCTSLFSTVAYGTAPANTLDAALQIVRHPGANVLDVYNTGNPQGPFQPTLAKAPNDWTMTISYVGGGLYAPTALGVDSTGSVWAANYFGGYASKLSATGVPASATGFYDPHLYESYGLAIDGQDSAWITVEESSGGINSGDGSITKFSSSGALLSGSGFTAGGVYYPYAIAADTNGNMWVADFGRSTATLMDTNGNSLSGASGYLPTGLSFPTSVALDNQHNAWFGVQGSSVEVAPNGASNLYNCCRSPSGIALDGSANVWIADYGASSLVELTPAGGVAQQLTTGTGGINHPESLVTDAGGNVWATNYRGNSISGFTGGLSSTAISPTTGLGIDAGLAPALRHRRRCLRQSLGIELRAQLAHPVRRRCRTHQNSNPRPAHSPLAPRAPAKAHCRKHHVPLQVLWSCVRTKPTRLAWRCRHKPRARRA